MITDECKSYIQDIKRLTAKNISLAVDDFYWILLKTVWLKVWMNEENCDIETEAPQGQKTFRFIFNKESK